MYVWNFMFASKANNAMYEYVLYVQLNLSDIRIIQKSKLTKFMLSIHQAFYYFLLCKQYAFCVVLDKAFHVKSLGTNLIRRTLLLSALAAERLGKSKFFSYGCVLKMHSQRSLNFEVSGWTFQANYQKQNYQVANFLQQLFSEQAID